MEEIVALLPPRINSTVRSDPFFQHIRREDEVERQRTLDGRNGGGPECPFCGERALAKNWDRGWHECASCRGVCRIFVDPKSSTGLSIRAVAWENVPEADRRRLGLRAGNAR